MECTRLTITLVVLYSSHIPLSTPYCVLRGPLSVSILGYGFVKEDAVAWVFRSKTSRYGSLNSQVMAAGDGRVKLHASLA